MPSELASSGWRPADVIDWPPEFYPLPAGVPGAICKGEARPCPKCREMNFLVVMTASGLPAVCCPNCVRRKDGDRVLGTLDRANWTFRPNPRERHHR